MQKVLAIAATVTIISSGSATPFDWPQHQGPDRNAKSKETGLLQEWPAGGPHLAWKVDGLGGGDSAPSIANRRIFAMTHKDNDEIVWALSERDGKEIWSTRLGPAHRQAMRQSQEGPGCTPTIDGDYLYVLGLAGNLVCLKVEDGSVVWQKNLVSEFGGIIPTWSFRESPLIDGDKVVVTPGGNDAMLVALNKRTGETIWKTQMPSTSQRETETTETRDRARGERTSNIPTTRLGRSGNQSNRTSGSPTTVTGTRFPGLFMSEHWGMTSFAKKVPNGRYLAKLYFTETYRGVTGPGQRVFSMNVEGQKFENFDIWKKAGGFMRAYIESVPVNVSDGEFKIDFIAKTQSPAINAIEIIPQTTDGATDDGKSSPIRIKAGQGDAFKDSRGREWSPAQGFEGGSFGGLRASANFSRRGGFGGGRRGRGPRSGAAYSSIIAYEFEGKRQYAQLVAEALIGVDPSDGKFLWRYDRASNRSRINCSTPVYHNGMVFAASAYSNGGGLVRLEKSGNGATTAEEVWFSKDMQNHHGGVLIIDGAVYGSNGGNGGGYLICLDFDTGEVLWNEADRDKRRVKKGSVAYADNRIYYRTEDGEMVLIEPNSKEYIERGRFMQPDRTSKPAWAHPVVANGKLYIRDQETLYCYDIKAQRR